MTIKLILASSSKYRAHCLEKLNIPFVAISPNIDENPKANEPPDALALRLAKEKAYALKKQFPNHLIIGSDQVACFDNQLIGKPGSYQQTIEQLQRQSGQTVIFYTGLCVLNSSTNQCYTDLDQTTVFFRALSDKQISNYVEQEQPFDCAGGFKSEGLGIALFNKIESEDPNALIGLPLIKLINLLKKFNFDIL